MGQSKLWETGAPFILGVIVLAIVAFLQWQQPAFIQISRNLIFDYYQQLKPREYKEVPVRVLDIDEESIRRLGQWPWDRRKVAEMVSLLQNMGAASIAFDVLFSEKDRTSARVLFEDFATDPQIQTIIDKMPDNDEVFAETIERGGVVTAFVLTNEKKAQALPRRVPAVLEIGDSPAKYLNGFASSTNSLPIFEGKASGNGAINFVPNIDGVIRTVPLLFTRGNEIYPSLAAEALRVAQRAGRIAIKTTSASSERSFVERAPGIVSIRIGAITVPLMRDGQLYAYYTPPRDDRRIPVWKLLEDPKSVQSKIAGHIILVGTSAAGLQDLRFSPLGVIPGVEMHAQALEQMITSEYLFRPEWATGVERVYLIVAGMLVVVAASFLGAIPAAAAGGVMTASATVASWFAFTDAHFLVDPITPSALALLPFAFAAGTRYFLVDRRQRFIRDAFASYVSPNLVDSIVSGGNDLQLGGKRRPLSFIFTDLEGFTSMIESSDPNVVMPILNEYLDNCIGIVFEHEGTLDKVVGDALHIMFSAPVEQDDHAARAVRCAIELDQFAEEFRRKKQKGGFNFGRTRIGVNSGEVMVGNFGGERLFDYTAHGNAINATARLEAANKQLGTRLCVSEYTVSEVPEFTGRPIGQVTLRGQTVPVRIFEPLTPDNDEMQWIFAYKTAFDAMEAEAENARALFEDLQKQYPEDVLVSLHTKRLQDGETGILIDI